MPAGTPVDDVYQALKRKGYGDGQAARIAQAQTHLSLQTGRPPQKKRSPLRGRGKSGRER